MRLGSAMALVRQNVARNPKHYLFASFGIVVGVSMLSFFVALGFGVRARVLNTYFPVDQVELDPARIGVLGVQRSLPSTELSDARLSALASLPGVTGVYPKQRSRFQARLWGGAGLFGRDAHAEAFFDGIAPELVRGELRRLELGRGGEEAAEDKRRRFPCDTSEDCPGGFDCHAPAGAEGLCRPHEYWTDFREGAVATPCDSVEGCPPGDLCHAGRCWPSCGSDPATCHAGAQMQICSSDADCKDGLTCQAPPCAVDADCPAAGTCEKGRCGGAPWRTCDFQRCRFQGGPRDQVRDTPEAVSGVLPGRCVNDVEPSDPSCVPVRCPSGTYCAGLHAASGEGVCARPLPALINPFLVDVFNATAASALNLARIADPRVVLGLAFRMQFGDSFFVRGVRVDRQVVRRARISGFSDKAPMLGVSLPLNVVRHANAQYRGREAAEAFDSVIVRTRANEDMSAVIRGAEAMSFSLAPSSRQARRLANMLLILTLVFAIISTVIMGIAAVNIAHTFLMMVAERRTEIGVLRALGATGSDIRLLVLIEAGLVGLGGGVVGHFAAWAASRAANAVAAHALEGLALLPGDFFLFEPWFLAVSLAGAVVFAVAGALAAARRAARLDPAVVLSTP